MIFASDLDQTLIYSRRSAGCELDPHHFLLVEEYQGQPLSFMSTRAVEALNLLLQHHLFLPVTTRTVEQYLRITYLKETFKPKYAITSNGGTVLINNVVDQRWTRQIASDLSHETVPFEQIKALWNRISHPDWMIGEKWCDQLFYVILFNRDLIPWDMVHDVISEIRQMGWDVSIQGRKIYSIPNVISKGKALKYVQSLLQDDVIVSAGDSLLDESLLQVADYHIVPRHGELFRHYVDTPNFNRFNFTNQSGIHAAEEVITFALSKVEG